MSKRLPYRAPIKIPNGNLIMVEEFFNELIGYCKMSRDNAANNFALLNELASVTQKQQEQGTELEKLIIKNIALERLIESQNTLLDETQKQLASIFEGMNKLLSEPNLKLENK